MKERRDRIRARESKKVFKKESKRKWERGGGRNPIGAMRGDITELTGKQGVGRYVVARGSRLTRIYHGCPRLMRSLIIMLLTKDNL